MNIFRTLIIPASDVEVARKVGAGFGTGGQGMWTTPLSPTGEEPATHYISTGWIPSEFSTLIPNKSWVKDDYGVYVLSSEYFGDIDGIWNIVSENNTEITINELQSLFDSVDISDQKPSDALERLGLQLVRSNELI